MAPRHRTEGPGTLPQPARNRLNAGRNSIGDASSAFLAAAAVGGGAHLRMGKAGGDEPEVQRRPSGNAVCRWGSAEDILAEIEHEDAAIRKAAQEEVRKFSKRLTAEEIDQAFEVQLEVEAAAAAEAATEAVSSGDSDDDAEEDEGAEGDGEQVMYSPSAAGEGQFRSLWKRSGILARGAVKLGLTSLKTRGGAEFPTSPHSRPGSSCHDAEEVGSPTARSLCAMQQRLMGVMPSLPPVSPTIAARPGGRLGVPSASSCAGSSDCEDGGEMGRKKSVGLKVVCEAAVTLTRIQARIAATRRALGAMSPSTAPSATPPPSS